jgi:hypothetical protein
MDPEVQKKLFGDVQVSKAAIGRLVDDIENIKKLSLENPELGSFQSRAMEYIKEKRELTEVQKNMRALNLKLAVNRMQFYSQEAFMKDPSEGFKSILDFSTGYANSGRDSVHARITTLKHDYANTLLGGLEKAGVSDIFLSGKIDLDVHKGIAAIAEGKAPEGISAEAAKAAQVIHNLNTKMFKDMRDAGAPVRYMPGYITAQTHNIAKVSQTDFKTWFNDVFPLLDKKRTFGTNSGDITAMGVQMQAIYKAIKAGSVGVDTIMSGLEIEDMLKNVGNTRSAAQKLSQSRFLHFKDPEGAFNYNSMYGNGSLAENVSYDFSRKATMIGSMQKLGTNPEAALLADMDRMEAKFRRDGRLDLADNLKRERLGVHNLYKEVMGSTSMPGQNTLAKVSLIIRQMNALSKLGYAGVRSISNFAVAAMEIKSQTGKNVLEAHWDTINEWMSAIPKDSQKDFARRAGIFLQDMNNEILNAGGVLGAHGKPGMMAQSMKMMFKLTALDMNTRSPKIAFGNMFMQEMADNSGKSFTELNPRTQANLLTAGFGAKDFDLFKYAIEEMPDGRKMVTSEAIGNLSEDIVSARAAELEMTPRKYIRELQQKFSGHMAMSGEIVSTSAGPRMRNILNAGTFTGTYEGEIRRLLGQFKSFAVGAHFTAARFLNSTPDEAALLKGIALSKGKDFNSFAQFLVGATIMGYIGQALVDFANGKGVKDPGKVATWIDAAAKGGAGALYTDFLAGEYDRFNFAENLLGPTVGQIAGPGAKLVTRGRKALTGEKAGSAGIDAVRLIRNNIPFQQVPLAKQALDYLQMNVINESLKPGHLSRSERFKRKDAKERTDISIPNIYDKLTGD